MRDDARDRVSIDGCVGGYGGCAVDGEAAGKNRDPPQHRSLRFGEQVVAPVEGGLQCPVTMIMRADSLRQQPKPILKPRTDVLDRKRIESRGGQLERERDSVQASTQLADRWPAIQRQRKIRHSMLCPVHEQLSMASERRNSARSAVASGSESEDNR